MGNIYKKIWAYINTIRTIPAMILFLISNQKHTIIKDIERWVTLYNVNNENLFLNLNWLLLYYPEFRNLFYYRLKRGNINITLIAQIFYPPMGTLYICTNDIGAGLFIQHGFSTIIAAKSIGENCWINQQVTIGYSNKTDCPIIGNNVQITAGAKVIGKVVVGNNSIIGANSVVVKDIPENCTVVGNPAYIVKKNGIKTKEYL